MPAGGRIAAAIAAVILAAAAFLAVERATGRTQHARMRDVVDARRELAATRLAPDGTAPRAGISAGAPIDVPRIPDDLATRLHGNPDFHRLSHRCGVCHATPDPRLHPAADWPAVIDRMTGVIRDAGLLPLGTEDRAAVLRILTAHAGDSTPR